MSAALYLLAGCVGVPDGVEPVERFEPSRYLGKWYEIARLDHSFERGLTQVSATYSKREDGGIRVVNEGYSMESGEWSRAEGKAFFVQGDEKGFLKVSFFGPFYGSYIIFDLDPDYRYAMVSGPNKSYLWLLARTPTIDKAIIEQFVRKAKRLGFDTDQLIYVDQGGTDVDVQG
ncbi:MAG: lipocalin family protein [Gammaproteobacteria bacterium]|jgi:apolipoprotein D and lipocalin family protein|nr:lipocalin family protein [Gammaproteobacteria bacterium]